jgi:hypothetical protein
MQGFRLPRTRTVCKRYGRRHFVHIVQNGHALGTSNRQATGPARRTRRTDRLSVFIRETQKYTPRQPSE